MLEGGARWVNTQQSMRDMQFAELRQVSGDNIRRASRVHPAMLGDVEDVNRANAETAQEQHARDITCDRLDRIKDALNSRLLPMFGSTGMGVEFDYENPVSDDREQAMTELTAKVNAAVALIGAGGDPESVLEAVGLPEMDFTEPEAPKVVAPPATEEDPNAPTPNADALEDAMAAAFRQVMNGASE
jgi:hypothetical protein